jgi:hypothetical protein
MAPSTEKDMDSIELTNKSNHNHSHSHSHGHAHMKSEDMPSLPTPGSASSPKARKIQLSAATIVPVWMAISAGVIIYNNHIYNDIKFKYPVFLVTWHLSFAVSRRRCCYSMLTDM